MGILQSMPGKLRIMKIHLPLVLAIAALSLSALAQQSSYILHRMEFKPEISAISFSPDEKLLLAGKADGSFCLLDPISFETTLEVKEAHAKAITAINMPPKMDYILTAGSNQIKTWSPGGGLMDILKGHATTVWNAEISNNGKNAVSTAFNKTFLLWDLSEGTISAKLRAHEDIVLAATISKDNLLIASGSSDETVKIWDLEKREVAKTFHGPADDVYDLCFSPDASLLALASAGESIRIYNLLTDSLTYILKGHRAVVRKVDFSPDGRYLVSASEDHSLILWDAIRGEKIYHFTDNQGAILDARFFPDGKSVYSISSDGTLTQWELHPEIFVQRYFDEKYRSELSANPVFEARRKGEAKKDYEKRKAEASLQKTAIIQRYYEQYLQEL